MTMFCKNCDKQYMVVHIFKICDFRSNVIKCACIGHEDRVSVIINLTYMHVRVTKNLIL